MLEKYGITVIIWACKYLFRCLPKLSKHRPNIGKKEIWTHCDTVYTYCQ